MEQLTKQQIVLLCLLVCFVSSVATGTVIVSLVDQAPPAISQTVNHVIERVVQTPSRTSGAITETVIVKDDQAVVDSIARVSNSLVRITNEQNKFVATGFIVSASGKILATTNVIPGQNLVAHLVGGNSVSISYLSTDHATGLSLFQADQSNDPKNSRVYSPITFADSDNLKLGQSVTLISIGEVTSVGTGIISSADKITANFDSPAILANLLGEVIGIKQTYIIASSASFTPSNTLKQIR